ncbi:MAG: hypothetical protein N2595_02610 [bacterium]|nr:hypothetical protein [bacterium]
MRSRTCLNEWWDFCPIYSDAPGDEPPHAGWFPRAYLVPSWWNKSLYAIRRRGEEWYYAHPDKEACLDDIEQYEFLFDAYAYPAAWTNAKLAWARRQFRLTDRTPHRRWHLIFDAVAPRSVIFVNGHRVAENNDAMLPCSVDVTDVARPGVNELAVLILDYPRDARGRTLTPSGNMMTTTMRGIWQDVWLMNVPAVHVSNVTIRTSTRLRQLEVRISITNADHVACDVMCEADVAPWCSRRPAARMRRELALGCQKTHLPARASAELIFVTSWPHARWWDPAHPHLYWLRTQLSVNGRVCDTYAERFGFREVWLEGIHLMLNDHPVHLFSDWGHKLTPFHHTAAWIRQWFGMLKDAHMNHTRLHTHPHPPLVLDLADEEGILVTGETAIHGSSARQAADDPAYWQAARDHVRRLVQRDKNHPSLILWSVENEMRWNRDETNLTREELPKLRALFNQLDPTRPAYHEGDSSLWDERTQPLISRHYNKECSGLGWWRRDRPLHAGEMAVYHYAGPHNTCHLAGDEAWADYRAIDRAAATDAALIIETGRTLGVCCFGPWNLSCLENLRPEPRTQHLRYRDFTTPGVKPLIVHPHCAEFAFWRRGKGYTPFSSFSIQAHAFRPLAVIDRSQRTQYFTRAAFVRELFVVNDTPAEVQGTLIVRLRHERTVLAEKHWNIRVRRGHVLARMFRARLPARQVDQLTYEASLRVANREKIHLRRTIALSPRLPARPALPSPASPIAVFGPGSLRTALVQLAVPHHYLPTLEKAAECGARILILEADTVTDDDAMREAVHAFARQGGRVIIMEQHESIFPRLALEDKPVWRVFKRAYRHPVLAGIPDHTLAAWGDASYAVEGSPACVARKLYRKDGRLNYCCLLDADESGFGPGGLAFMALLEAPVGRGLVLASQLRITETISSIPAAQKLFCNLLSRAHTYVPPPPRVVHVCAGDATDAILSVLPDVRKGASLVINNATESTLAALSTALKRRLRVQDQGPVYQLVRAVKDPVLSGISNEDTCGIERFSYCYQEENLLVSTRCLAPTRGLEPLLVTPTRSFLKELFVGDGRTEPLRAHTISRCIRNVRKTPAIGLGRLRVGRGALYFNQFAPPLDKRAKFHTVLNRLCANLGAPRSDSLLDPGERVRPATRGTGSPHVLWLLDHPCDQPLQSTILQATYFTGERILPSAVLSIGTWRQLSCADGRIIARECGSTRPLCLYSRLHSPVSRKNVALDIEVPNPLALTFLEAVGRGTLAVYVNGLPSGTQELHDAPVLFPDIPLEQGWNQIVLAWTPPDPDAPLQLTWRSITGLPETSFAFA